MMDFDPGAYRGTVTEQAWQRARTGSKMLVLSVRIHSQVVEGENGSPTTIDVEPRTRTIRLVLANDTQVEMVVRKLRHAGFRGKRWSEVAMEGAEVIAICEEGSYRGAATEQWDLALPGRGPLESDPEVAKEMDEEYPLAAAVGSGSASSGEVVDEDSDIPF